VGKRTAMIPKPAKSKLQKAGPSMRELNEKAERIKARLNSRASSIDSDTKSLFMTIRNVGKAPLASAGWILAMALTALPTRSSLPLWLKIAASTAREVLANPKSSPARTPTSRASKSRASSMEP
jgi:hypothetical protein